MISFRFHVVSITAVFLGIAIGVVVGSTYVDGAVVDGLRNRISSVSDNLDAREAETNRLQSQLGEADDYIAASSDFAVTERLTEVPVLVVAARGIDGGAVEEVVRLARVAGAVVPGVVWIEPRWSSEDDQSELAELADAPSGADREQIWADVWSLVAAEVAAAELPELDPGTDGTATTVPPAPSTDVLDALVVHGFLSLDGFGDEDTSLSDLAGDGAALIVVGGSNADDDVAPVLRAVVEAGVTEGLPTVLGDAWAETDDGPGRGEDLGAALPEPVREALAVVDDVDRQEGQVATVLAVAAAGQGVTGHYGFGSGASGPLPAWTPP
jgi:hypothetical protein